MILALQLYLVAMLIMSLINFAAFGLDKHRAQNDGWRIPEKTLHTFSMLGGWPGALAGQRYFRHKTQKMSFRVMLWMIIAIHVVLIGVCIWYR